MALFALIILAWLIFALSMHTLLILAPEILIPGFMHAPVFTGDEMTVYQGIKV